MRWVKETFPPRERARWLLITMRLSTRSLAGTARTLVAVGTVSEAFMFLTTAAARGAGEGVFFFLDGGGRRTTQRRADDAVGLGLRRLRLGGSGRGSWLG